MFCTLPISQLGRVGLSWESDNMGRVHYSVMDEGLHALAIEKAFVVFGKGDRVSKQTKPGLRKSSVKGTGCDSHQKLHKLDTICWLQATRRGWLSLGPTGF